MILFGVRSSITVEYEESCLRRGIEIYMAVSLNGSPRLAGPAKIVTPETIGSAAGQPFLSCAFSPHRRRELISMGRDLGLVLSDALVDPHAFVASNTRVGPGTFVNAGSIIGAVSIIGEGVLINRSASVGHHCLIEDFVSIGPGATLAGNIHVGECAMIGAGATILPNVRIGRGAVVSAGSVVKGHVPDNSTVAGNPARPKPFNPRRSTLNVEGWE